MNLYSSSILYKKLNWIQSAGINNKKYNPWVGAQLIGVRDQFLIFHPLILLWDLKRIQLFLSKVQSYTNYSILLVDSRPSIQSAIENYLQVHNIPQSRCHVLHFDFPGTLSNRYYMSTQSKTTSLISSRQIIIFFDYFLNKQFYTESLIVPSIRMSLYSLQNLPTNMQYGLPAKSGLLIAIRLLLKLLLKPLFHLQVRADQYSLLISNFQKTIPHRDKKIRISQRTAINEASQDNKNNNPFFYTTELSVKYNPWKRTNENKSIRNRFSLIKVATRKRLQTKKARLFRNYRRFYKKKLKSKLVTYPNKYLHRSLQQQVLTKIFSQTKLRLTKQSLLSLFASTSFFQRRSKLLVCSKKLRLLKVTKRKLTKKRKKTLPTKAKIKKTSKILGRKKTLMPKQLMISSLNLLSLVTPFASLNQSKKRLIAKYNRTCNIKTQKEWQDIKQKNKLKLDRKKAALRAKRMKPKRRKVKKTLQYRYRPQVNKRKEPYKRPHWTKNSPYPNTRTGQIREFLNFKPKGRSFSSKRPVLQQKHTSKNSRVIFNWTVALFGTKEARTIRKKSLRIVRPTKRIMLAWRRYVFYPYAKLHPKYIQQPFYKSMLFYKSPVSIALSNKKYFRENCFYKHKVDFDRMLTSIPGLRRWKTKSRRKLRVLKFKQWRRVMKRIARRRDRRWRQKKWKRAALRQFKTRYQRHYTCVSLYSGVTYWRRCKILRVRRTFNWRKWRSRYFRRYTRRETVRLHLLKKAPNLFFSRIRRGRVQLASSKFIKGYKYAQTLQPRVLIAVGNVRIARKLNWCDRHQGPNLHLTKRFTKKRFCARNKAWKKYLTNVPRFRVYRRKIPTGFSILKTRMHFRYSRLLLSTIQIPVNAPLEVKKKNYTNQLWFRAYRNSKLNSYSKQKSTSKSFRQLIGQKKRFIGRNRMLQSYWSSHLTIKNLLKYKHRYLWNWRLFKDRQRTTEEFKRYVQNFQYTSIKLHKHKVLSITTAKKLRQEKVQKLFAYYRTNLHEGSLGHSLLPFFKPKPITLSKFSFIKFNGKLTQNRNILVGFNTKQGVTPSFIQCYSKRRFWANDNFGPSPLRFWLSPKARRKKTPKQWALNSSLLNFQLNIKLPNFSCLAFQTPAVSESGLSSLYQTSDSAMRVKELNRANHFKKTVKFVINSRDIFSNKRERWLWYFMKNQYPSQSIVWQQSLNYTKQTRRLLRLKKARKVIHTHYRRPKKIVKNMAYYARCDKRRRRRLRERTFQGPTRYRRKYRTQFMYTHLIRLNSHRSRYGKPDTRNHVNHYFIRKLVLRRFLRLIYGPKLTNKYFKHFSNLLFIKKFKFWTLYTFFYLRLDFVAILLKFAMNLAWARYLIQHEIVLVNGQVEKASHSIFLGDIIRLRRFDDCSISRSGIALVPWIRNIAAFSTPRVTSSFKYQTCLRIPPFFEYSSRIKAGTMFRLPWYYEVRGKLVNKENFLLLARGPHSI